MIIKIICFSFALNLADVIPIGSAQLTRDHYAVADRQGKVHMGDGDYKYSYENTNGIIKNETGYIKNPGAPTDEQINVKEGCYSYTSPEGAFVSVIYTADERGYNPKTRITYPHEPNHQQHMASPCGPLSSPASLPRLQAPRPEVQVIEGYLPPVSGSYLPPQKIIFPGAYVPPEKTIITGAYVPPEKTVVSGSYLPPEKTIISGAYVPPEKTIISGAYVPPEKTIISGAYVPPEKTIVSGSYLPPEKTVVGGAYLPPAWDTSSLSSGWAKQPAPPQPTPDSHSSIWDIPKNPIAPAPVPATKPPVVVTAKPVVVPVKPTEYTTAIPPTTAQPLPKRTQLPPDNYPSGGYSSSSSSNSPKHVINTLTTCACPESESPDSFSFRLADGSHVLVTYDNQGFSYKPSVKVYPNGYQNFYTCTTNTLTEKVNDLAAVIKPNPNAEQVPPAGYA
ncbi:unnamed protein product [Allacma fusca]|uniref:Uncharacterized protein n=1 Tax=Allacma fusca TaxID=39272 RepID=A0A8J2J1U6_9HEXA|nr:unnamed protein product [Allacma fusca]